jgi:excisionase family DNA binding protein
VDNELLNIEEASRFLHIKASTVRSWILFRKVAFVKLGRRVFLRKSDLEKLIQDSVVPAQPREGA